MQTAACNYVVRGVYTQTPAHLYSMFEEEDSLLKEKCSPCKTAFVQLTLITWMDDAGVTLVDGVSAAGNGISHRRPLQGTFAADDVILTAASAHNVPLGARAVMIQVPVI